MKDTNLLLSIFRIGFGVVARKPTLNMDKSSEWPEDEQESEDHSVRGQFYFEYTSTACSINHALVALPVIEQQAVIAGTKIGVTSESARWATATCHFHKLLDIGTDAKKTVDTIESHEAKAQ